MTDNFRSFVRVERIFSSNCRICSFIDYSYDGLELLHTETLSTETIYDNGTVVYADASYNAVPLKATDAPGYVYVFRGWSSSSNSSTPDAVLTGISQDLTVYAAFERRAAVAPTFSVTDASSGSGDAATVTVSSWGSYPNVTQYVCAYDTPSGGLSDLHGGRMTLTPGNGIDVSGDSVTITPTFDIPGAITAQYLTFSNVNGDTVNVNVDIFS